MNTALEENRASLTLTNDSLRRQRYVSDMTAAQAAIDRGEMQYAIYLLVRNKPELGQSDLRGIEWDYLWNLTRTPSPSHEFSFLDEPVSMAVSRSEKYIAVAQANGMVFLFEGPTWRRSESSIQASSWERWDCPLAFSKDQDLLAFVTKKGTCVAVMDIATRSIRQEIDLAPGIVRSIEFSPTDDVLAIALLGTTAFDGNIQLRNVMTREILSQIELPSGWLSLAFAPNGMTLAVADFSGRNFIWEWKTLKKPAELPGKSFPGSRATFSQDGRLLAIGGWNSTVRVWNIQSGTYEHMTTLLGHSNTVFGVAFANGQGLLASASRDATVRIWDVQGLRTNCVIKIKNGKRVNAVAFLTRNCLFGRLVLYFPCGSCIVQIFLWS
jgi:WD40 repeat protein